MPNSNGHKSDSGDKPYEWEPLLDELLTTPAQFGTSKEAIFRDKIAPLLAELNYLLDQNRMEYVLAVMFDHRHENDGTTWGMSVCSSVSDCSPATMKAAALAIGSERQANFKVKLMESARHILTIALISDKKLLRNYYNTLRHFGKMRYMAIVLAVYTTLDIGNAIVSSATGIEKLAVIVASCIPAFMGWWLYVLLFDHERNIKTLYGEQFDKEIADKYTELERWD